MVFWDAADGAMFDAVVNGQFRNVAYQTIDFGAEPQIIPTAFATWLAANADYEASGSAPTLVTVKVINNSAGEFGVYYTNYNSAMGGILPALAEIDSGEERTIECVNNTVLLVRFYGNSFSCDACNGKIEYINGGGEYYAFYADDSKPAYLNGAVIDFS
jgi:hypothetical protein